VQLSDAAKASLSRDDGVRQAVLEFTEFNNFKGSPAVGNSVHVVMMPSTVSACAGAAMLCGLLHNAWLPCMPRRTVAWLGSCASRFGSHSACCVEALTISAKRSCHVLAKQA
jgi:hypothetical protein